MAVAMFILGLVIIASVIAGSVFFIMFAMTEEAIFGALCFATMVTLALLALAESILAIINLAMGN